MEPLVNRRRIVVIGGGTISPVRNHLALCAPALGQARLACAQPGGASAHAAAGAVWLLSQGLRSSRSDGAAANRAAVSAG